MDSFKACTTDLEVHNKLWQLLCCDYLHETSCRDNFQRFRIASRQKLQNPQANSLQNVDDILKELSRMGELDVGKYEFLKKLVHGIDVAVIQLIEGAEKTIGRIKDEALLLESCVTAVKPDSLLAETKEKVDLILLSVMECVMCKVNQGITDSETLIAKHTKLIKVSYDYLKLWHGECCRCSRKFGQKLVLTFVESGAKHLEKGEEAFENFERKIAPKLKNTLHDYTKNCVHVYLNCGKPVANVSSSVLTYWAFSSVADLEKFWKLYDDGIFDKTLCDCFNAAVALELLNVTEINLKTFIRKENFEKCKEHLKSKEVAARKEEPIMTESAAEYSLRKVKGTLQWFRFPKKDDPGQGYSIESTAMEIAARKKQTVMRATKAEYFLDDIAEHQRFPFSFTSKEKGVYPEKGVSELDLKSSKELVWPAIGGEQKIYSSLHEKKDPTAEYSYLRKPTEKSETFDVVKKETEISYSIQKKSPKHQEHPEQSYPSRHVKSPKVTHLYDIDLEIPDDMSLVHVRGMMVLSGMVVIVESWNRRLRLFSTDGKYLSSITVDSFIDGITRVSATEFALIEVFQNCISFWRIDGERITNTGKTFRLGEQYTNAQYTVCFNETYFCLISKWESSVFILDKVGKDVKKFQIKEAFKRRITYMNDVHMDKETHNIFITCNQGVLCVSVEGVPLWRVDVVISSQGITEINGELCVAGFYRRGLHMITKEGEYKGILMEMDDKPEHLYYDEDEHLLIVSFWASNKLSIYQIKV